MKVQIIVLTLAAVVLAAPQKPAYTTKWDGVDLDQILRSDRLLNNYVKCLLDTGRCTPDGSDLKRILPDALATDCESCSETQKNGSTKVIHYLIQNKESTWNQLAEKYDRSGVYRTRHPEIFAHKK